MAGYSVGCKAFVLFFRMVICVPTELGMRAAGIRAVKMVHWFSHVAFHLDYEVTSTNDESLQRLGGQQFVYVLNCEVLLESVIHCPAMYFVYGLPVTHQGVISLSYPVMVFG